MPRGVYTHRPRPPAPSIENADGSVSVPLHAKDGSIRAYTLVDAADAAFVNQWRWALMRSYAMRNNVGGHPRFLRLHRELLGLVHGDGLEGDHINRDRLDNRRSNLRIIPDQGGGNGHNLPSQRGSSSPYRGVSWSKRRGLWIAQIMVKGKCINLGGYADEREAAEVAREARARLLPYAID